MAKLATDISVAMVEQFNHWIPSEVFNLFEVIPEAFHAAKDQVQSINSTLLSLARFLVATWSGSPLKRVSFSLVLVRSLTVIVHCLIIIMTYLPTSASVYHSLPSMVIMHTIKLEIAWDLCRMAYWHARKEVCTNFLFKYLPPDTYS